MSLSITVNDGNGHAVTAEFTRSEDAGYSRGRLLLDLPNGDVISIRRIGRRWVETLISGGIGRRDAVHDTRKAAMHSAAWELLSETILTNSLTSTNC